MVYLAMLLMFFSGSEMEKGVTANIQPIEEQFQYEEPAWGMRSTYTGAAADHLSFRLLLPKQTGLVLRCDPNAGTLADTLAPEYGLTAAADAAVAKAPVWLRPELVDNLGRVDTSRQNILADMILNPRESRLRDEIAFQVAHISSDHLRVMNLDVITQNVDSLYVIDGELKYVEIVDYGNPDADSDYYSTTRYKVLKDGNLITCEIPRDIYYWYVIHPRGTDETPTIIYDKFWREFLYYDNGTKSYTEGGTYPLLQSELDTVSFAWEVTPTSCGGGAIDAVSRWVNGVVKWGATAPRPIQPILVACDHDGNCGEFQDITWAGNRTALLPTVGTLDINEDHVWCTNWKSLSYDFPEQTAWRPDSGGAFDKDHGGSKYCSLIWDWRGDGFQTSRIEAYSKSCTLTVAVYDTSGKPMPNSYVNLLSQGWQTGQLYNGFSGLTDRNGSYTTVVGEEQDYYVRVRTKSLGRVVDSIEALAGSRFFLACSLTKVTDQPRELDIVTSHRFPIEGTLDTVISVPNTGISYLVFFNNHPGLGEVISGTVSLNGTNLDLAVDAEYDIGRCPTFSYEELNSTSNVTFAPGKLTDFFVTDYQGILALGVGEMPSREKKSLALRVEQLPAKGHVNFTVSGMVESARLSIFDATGRRIYSTPVQFNAGGTATVTWADRVMPTGVYFVRVEAGSQAATGKVVFVR